MTGELDRTHEPALRSWVTSANDGTTDFPIQNLPYGVFRRAGRDERARVGIAIGAEILDVTAACAAGVYGGLAEAAAAACAAPALNDLMALGHEHWSALRAQTSEFLRAGGDGEAGNAKRGDPLLVSMAGAELFVPARIGDYTDFYASVHHATNVGSMFRPDNALLPNYKFVPIGYHGRASSIVASGTRVRRPNGQVKGATDAPPAYGPSQSLDYESELGMFVGPGNSLGEPVPIASAAEHLFGVCLVNDWSARDIQTWEYQPLGPFLSKSFATTVSPWVVTMEALAPFRAPAFARPAGDPAPLPYLSDPVDQEQGGLEITLEVWLRTQRLRDGGAPAVRLSRASFTGMYWTVAQLLAHHASNGCNLRPGDLLASGTVSGPSKDARGCLLELTWRGSEPLTLPDLETRTFLEDGDEVIMRGYCERDGATRIGFGVCAGEVVAAVRAG